MNSDPFRWGNRRKLTAAAAVAFGQCFRGIAMFETESLELLWNREEAERGAYR